MTSDDKLKKLSLDSATQQFEQLESDLDIWTWGWSSLGLLNVQINSSDPIIWVGWVDPFNSINF